MYHHIFNCSRGCTFKLVSALLRWPTMLQDISFLQVISHSQNMRQNKCPGKGVLDQRLDAFQILIGTATPPCIELAGFAYTSEMDGMPVQFLSIWVTKTWICFLEHLSSSVCHCCKNMNFSFLRIRKLHIPPLFSVISFRCSQQGKNSSSPK